MKYVLLTVAYIFYLGCNNVKAPDQTQINKSPIEKQYQEFRDDLKPEVFFSHFPDRMSNSFFSHINKQDMDISHNYELYMFNCREGIISQLTQNLEKTALKVYEATDVNLNVIKRDFDNYRVAKKRIVNGEIFLPFFEKNDVMSKDISTIFFSSETSCGLNSQFKIYIIECMSNYNPNLNKDLSIFKQLPRTQNKAFSRGICINEKDKCIIYWTIFI